MRLRCSDFVAPLWFVERHYAMKIPGLRGSSEKVGACSFTVLAIVGCAAPTPTSHKSERFRDAPRLWIAVTVFGAFAIYYFSDIGARLLVERGTSRPGSATFDALGCFYQPLDALCQAYPMFADATESLVQTLLGKKKTES